MTPTLRRRWPSARFRLAGVILSGAVAAGCGESSSQPTPQPSSTPAQDKWFTFVVQCANCPGLTNAEIDRSVVPVRARLRVGQRTSLRAVVRDPCEPGQVQLDVVRWVAGNSSVVKVEPSATDSAIVTALGPGSSSITVERRYADGTLGQNGLKDAQSTSGCGLLPDVVFEVTP